MQADPINLGQMLRAQVKLQPERIAARDLNRSLTYRQWNARANRLANALLGLGLVKGDRIAVLAYNRIEWAEIYAATAISGLVAVPVNFRLSAPEAAFIFDHCGASAIIVENSLAPIVDEIGDDLPVDAAKVIVIDGDTQLGRTSYESLLAKASDQHSDTQIDVADPWCIMYTSGTTGRPKGAVRSHRGMSMLALMTAIELKLDRRDDALLVMPMCHANSLNFFTAFVYIGGTVTIFSRQSFDPALCLRTFSDTGATFTSLVPTHYSLMLEMSETERRGLSLERVEKLMISSAPARPDTKRSIMQMFPGSHLFELYGSTEAGWVTMLHPHEQFDKLGTVGREVVGSLPIRFFDDEGCEVEDGEPGELYSCGPYAFEGYWNQPEATAESFRGRYLSVGDIALRDPDGFIQLIDRKKNIIISGGENIYPSEVETVLGSHQAVSDVAVVGRPDAKWGESVVAAVVLRTSESTSSAELIDFARHRLAGFKRPRDIIFLNADEMPRNATGKVLHRELRELLITDSTLISRETDTPTTPESEKT